MNNVHFDVHTLYRTSNEGNEKKTTIYRHYITYTRYTHPHILWCRLPGRYLMCMRGAISVFPRKPVVCVSLGTTRIIIIRGPRYQVSRSVDYLRQKRSRWIFLANTIVSSLVIYRAIHQALSTFFLFQYYSIVQHLDFRIKEHA